jgi:membrane protease YdiL (CAAX protease family)
MSTDLALATEERLAYWNDTRRPFVNLVFVLPWIIVYECGLWATGAGGEVARNGADAWLRTALATWGVSSAMSLPLFVLGGLLVWHLVSDHPSRVSGDTLAGMFAESLLFAFVLILLGQTADTLLHSAFVLEITSPPVASLGWELRLISFVGAGIYEEFVFRLCLLPVSYFALRVLLLPHQSAIVGAILVTSVVFGLAHYFPVDPETGSRGLLLAACQQVWSRPELWFGFAFRTIAGIFFAALFYWRGFGITVGCHALYDVVVGVILMNRL